MARYAVVFDRDAHADLAGIRDHIAQARGPDVAEAFIGRLITHCETFATVPHRGTKRDAIRPGLRTVTWRRTITIAFIVSDEQSRVVVLGAFYRGRDVLSVLKRRNP